MIMKAQIAQKKIKGYKQTEIGTIPEDWEVKKLADVASLKARIGWQGLTTAEYKDFGEYYLITGTDFKNGFIDWENCHYVDKVRYSQDKNIQIKEHDVLVTKDGTIGKVALINRITKPATLNSGVFVIRPFKNQFFPDYFYYLLLSKVFFKFLVQLSAGSTINHLYQKDFVNFSFQVPSNITEQTAIATVLSDTDALIECSEKLIAKKKAIKQGAMQQLLTGKKRLPGFSGGWEVKKLGEVGNCIRGVSYNGERDLSLYDTNITVRLLRSNNIRDGKIDLSELQFVNISRVKQIQALQKNDIVICMANGSKQLVGKSAMFDVSDNYTYTFGAFMGCFRTNPNQAVSRFISFIFQTYQYRSYIDVLLSGSSINNLKPSDIESIEIAYPKKEEQTAIAAILSDMDAEIESLEQKRDKYTMLKQGMMQQLLTGRIRIYDNN